MKKGVTAVIIFWLAIVCGSFWLNMINDTKANEQLAFETARAFFQQMVVTRSWNAEHGGVYVPVSEKTQPNPYLEDPLRDLTTVENIRLTKVNPAFMTRQIAEYAMQEGKVVQFHITSLNPIRPANKAEVWEREWLLTFEEGALEKGGFVSDGADSYFRYMAPLYTELSCLKCHAKQGYQEGDVRGGISVTLQHFTEKNHENLIFGYGVAGLCGVVLILIGGSLLERKRIMLVKFNQDLKDEVEERQKIINELQVTKDEIKTLSGILPICMHCQEIRDDKGYWNQLEQYIAKHTEARFSHSICDKCIEKHYS